MSQSRLLSISVTCWLVVVLASFATRLTLAGSSMSFTEDLGWLFGAIAPIPVLFAIVRGAAAPVTIQQVLYDAEHVDATTSPARKDRS